MKILIVSATWMEVKVLADEFKVSRERSHMVRHYHYGETDIDVLVTGIGMTAATFHLTNTLVREKYDMVLNAGIAGSFDHDLQIGDVVNVVSEEFGDLGIEKQDEFLTLFESGFMNPNEYPFENGHIKPIQAPIVVDIRKVRGLTTGKSHGRYSSITEIKNKFSAQVETMEGAAVFYVCNWLGVPSCQMRAISNYVEPRDTAKWNIPLALENLTLSVVNVLQDIDVVVD